MNFEVGFICLSYLLCIAIGSGLCFFVEKKHKKKQSDNVVEYKFINEFKLNNNFNKIESCIRYAEEIGISNEEFKGV